MSACALPYKCPVCALPYTCPAPVLVRYTNVRCFMGDRWDQAAQLLLCACHLWTVQHVPRARPAVAHRRVRCVISAVR
jgi:hypothetical protein